MKKSDKGTYREEARRADVDAANRWRTYQTYSAYRMYSEQNATIINHLGKQDILLEIGAGIGNFLADATRADGQFSSVHALDVSLETAIIASKNIPKIKSYILGQAEKLPYEDNSFDGVTARGVIHHLENVKTAIKEIYRVLKPGGKLVIFEGNPASGFRRIALGFADFLHMKHEDTQFRHLYPEEMRHLLFDFKDVKMEHINGLLAPLAYIGIGNKPVWELLFKIRGFFEKTVPKSFDWWLLWTATK